MTWDANDHGQDRLALPDEILPDHWDLRDFRVRASEADQDARDRCK